MNDLEDMLKAAFDGTDVQVIAIDEDGPRLVTTPCAPFGPTDLRERYPDWHLIDTNSMQEVVVGEILRTADGQEWIMDGGRPPHKPSSTGRVFVKDPDYEGDGLNEREFFPSVFDLKWFHKSEVTIDV